MLLQLSLAVVLLLSTRHVFAGSLDKRPEFLGGMGASLTRENPV